MATHPYTHLPIHTYTTLYVVNPGNYTSSAESSIHVYARFVSFLSSYNYI